MTTVWGAFVGAREQIGRQLSSGDIAADDDRLPNLDRCSQEGSRL
jgi:hypothetical protein